VLVALDAATGRTLWTASFDAGDFEVPYSIALATNGSNVYVGGGASRDAFVLAYDIPTLVAPEASISLAAGGSQSFGLRAGQGHAGSFYLVLGSASGTSPGFPLAAGLELPLAFDEYFLLTLKPSGAFSGFFGVLDGDGLGNAALTLPAGVDPGLAGVELHHAYAAGALLGVPDFASNALSVQLVP
jgi:hypothetical protein